MFFDAAHSFLPQEAVVGHRARADSHTVGGNFVMRVKLLAALIAAASLVEVSACASPSTEVASPDNAAAAPSSPAGATSSPVSAGGKVHQVTLNRTTSDGYSYRISVTVELGTPTQDPTEVSPDQMDIVLPITLLSGTLTNTTPGGHDLSSDIDGITGLSLFIGPALPPASYTCKLVPTSLAFIQFVSVSPYDGCGRIVDNLQPAGDTGIGAPDIEIPSGQSIPLTVIEGDSEHRPGAVAVNVPEPDADKIAADFAAAKVCILLSPSGGMDEDDYSAGSCA
jgi:hypothetical protein